MKKFLLTLAVALMATSSYATREVDWSVDTIYAPTKINSTDQGSSFSVHLVFKNNGVDTVYATDTMWIQFAVIQASQIRILYPGPQTNYYQPFAVKKKVAPGDTVHWKGGPFTTALKPTWFSLNCTFSAACLIVNRKQPDNIVSEPQGTSANNVKSAAIVWYNPQQWGVGINDVSANNLISVYPNPAKDNLHVSMNMVDVSATAEVNIIDMTGKVIYTETASNGNSFDINTATFPKGLYLVQVKNGELTSTTRLSIN